LRGTESSQAVGSKYKKVILEDKEEQQLSKKTKEKQLGKYHRNTTVKMRSVNTCERYMCDEQNCLVYNSRYVKKFIFVFSLLIVTLSYSFLPVPDTLLSSSGISSILTPTP